MKFTIAIQPDKIMLNVDRKESYSDRWVQRAHKLGHQVKLVDVWRPDILDQLQGCDGFMWRFIHYASFRRLAHRLVPVIEHQLGIPVFPDWRTAWHYDDKISQSYLLRAAEIPIPKTWVLWEYDEAIKFASTAQYPFVLKLTGGASSENIRLVKDYDQALFWIETLFERGIHSLEVAEEKVSPVRRIRSAAKSLLTGRLYERKSKEVVSEFHNNYFLVQEFLKDNAFDTRVTVIGNRAFAFRRFNRPDDFRSSGSGNFDVDFEQINIAFVRLAFRTAMALGTQSIAIDGLMRGEEIVVGEISYTYVSWMVQSCPGHWELHGDPDTGELVWCEGQMWPEDAIFIDFLSELKALQHQDKAK